MDCPKEFVLDWPDLFYLASHSESDKGEPKDGMDGT